MPMNLNFASDALQDLKRKVNSAIYGSWDIVDHVSKEPICEYDTFIGFDFISSAQLPSYPIQSGSFRNYNKVNNPNNTHISLAVSGNRKVLEKAIALLEKYNESVDLVDIQTPFKTFISYNITNMNYGVHTGETISRLMIEFDVHEIRQSDVIFTKVSDSNYSGNEELGKSQGEEVTSQSLIKNIFSRF